MKTDNHSLLKASLGTNEHYNVHKNILYTFYIAYNGIIHASATQRSLLSRT
jgi:alcohol dehydrogenase YqhD (iron-dependent ADH family)